MCSIGVVFWFFQVFCLLSLSKVREDITEWSPLWWGKVWQPAFPWKHVAACRHLAGSGSTARENPVLSWLCFLHVPFVSPLSCSVSPFWKWQVLAMEPGSSRPATSGLNCSLSHLSRPLSTSLIQSSWKWKFTIIGGLCPKELQTKLPKRKTLVTKTDSRGKSKPCARYCGVFETRGWQISSLGCVQILNVWAVQATQALAMWELPDTRLESKLPWQTQG